MDKQSIFDLNNRFQWNKEYLTIMRRWQKPLQDKQLKRERKELTPVEQVEEMDEVTYVHNTNYGVRMPPSPDQIFAVVRIHN